MLGRAIWQRLILAWAACSVTAHLLKCAAVLQKQPHVSQSNSWACLHRRHLKTGVLYTHVWANLWWFSVLQVIGRGVGCNPYPSYRPGWIYHGVLLESECRGFALIWLSVTGSAKSPCRPTHNLIFWNGGRRFGFYIRNYIDTKHTYSVKYNLVLYFLKMFTCSLLNISFFFVCVCVFFSTLS